MLTMTKKPSTTEWRDVARAYDLLRAAVEARDAADRAQSATRPKLSAEAWRRGLLAFAGHDAALVGRLRERMHTRPNLFMAASSYVHEVSKLLQDGWWWAPGPDMPTTLGADRVQAEIEVGRFEGANIVTLCLIAVEDLAERHPEMFGSIGSLDAYNAERAAVEAHRVRTADAVAALPAELLRGVASVRGVAIEPVRDLARRLIESALANPERVAMASRA